MEGSKCTPFESIMGENAEMIDYGYAISTMTTDPRLRMKDTLHKFDVQIYASTSEAGRKVGHIYKGQTSSSVYGASNITKHSKHRVSTTSVTNYTTKQVKWPSRQTERP